jgi:hypothetical protein
VKALGYNLDPERIDDEAIDFFTCGQCWALAEVLERTFGWESIIEGDGWSEDSWYHAVVMHPDGELVDINGFSYAGDLHRERTESWVRLAKDCWTDHMDEFSTSFEYYRRRSLEVAENFEPVV